MRTILFGCALVAAGLGAARPAIANLVVNGGFETGDFSGWTQSGRLDSTLVTSGGYGFPGIPHSGGFFAALGPVGGDGFLSQDLATTPGASYHVSYDLGSDGAMPNDFSASFGGQSIFSTQSIPRQGYQLYSFDILATSNVSTLRFGFQNSPGFLNLDDVSVEWTSNPKSNAPVVPEPATLVSAGLGCLGSLAYLWRRRRTGPVS